MVDPRAKGARGESQVRDILREHTSLNWERTPGSGALDEKHGLKGDLYVPNEKNIFCVEVKNYEEDHISTKILTSKDPQVLNWWSQAERQALQVSRKPLLIFKHNRSKWFVAYTDLPNSDIKNMLILDKFFVSVLTEWLEKEKPKFIQ
jgi:Holliday junction resolvase